jgi:dipeptidyl aminopeptidase/acylaminoacyl peptidase
MKNVGVFLRRLLDQRHRRGASRTCLFVSLLVFCGCGSVRVEQWGRRVIGHGNSATWSPDGKSIAFLDHEELYVVSAEGRSAARNLAPGMRVRLFTWSPDGKRIAFGTDKEPPRHAELDVDQCDRMKDHSGEVGVVSADGKSDARILTPGARIASFVWSPESREILCEVYRYNAPRDSNELQTADTPDSAELQVIDTGSGAARSLESPWSLRERSTSLWRWLDDGNIALFDYRRPARSIEWHFIDRFGNTNPKVTSKEKLFYWATDSTSGDVCWMMNADGTERVRLAVPKGENGKISFFPSLSTAGKKLAVVTGNVGTWRILVTDLQGESWLKLGGSLDAPQWSPDGKWLTCTEHLSGWPWGDYLLVSADGRFRTQIREPFVFAPHGNNALYVTKDDSISVSRLWIHWWPFKVSKAK